MILCDLALYTISIIQFDVLFFSKYEVSHLTIMKFLQFKFISESDVPL